MVPMTTDQTPPPAPPLDVHQRRTLSMTSRAVATGLPAFLAQATRLAWRTDRRAVLTVAAGRTIAAAARRRDQPPPHRVVIGLEPGPLSASTSPPPCSSSTGPTSTRPWPSGVPP